MSITDSSGTFCILINEVLILEVNHVLFTCNYLNEYAHLIYQEILQYQFQYISYQYQPHVWNQTNFNIANYSASQIE
jgi:hypothetical protein